MSQENVEIVRDAAAAFNRGDLDAWLDEYWTDDIDYRAVEGAIDDRGPMHGKDAMRAYCRTGSTRSTTSDVEPVELIDAGEDQVVAVLRISGRAKLSGVETDLTFAVLYTIRDGKIARGREYWTRERGPRSRRAAGVARYWGRCRLTLSRGWKNSPVPSWPRHEDCPDHRVGTGAGVGRCRGRAHSLGSTEGDDHQLRSHYDYRHRDHDGQPGAERGRTRSPSPSATG